MVAMNNYPLVARTLFGTWDANGSLGSALLGILWNGQWNYGIDDDCI